MSAIVPWTTSCDGNFAEAFIKRCLTPIEMGELLQQPPLPQSTAPNSNRFGVYKDEADVSKVASDTRKTLVDIVLTWTNVYAGGVILRSTNDETKLFLAFEFISAHKRVSTSDVVGDSDNNSSTVNNHKIDPLVFVNIASSTTMKQAELLLRDEDLEVITCSDEVLFQMARVLRGPFAKSGLIDIVSSLTVVEGYLEPICPPSTPPTPLNVTGEEINVKNIEEEDYDEYNDSFEFEEEIYSIDGFGAIKPEFIVAKNINGFVRWRATTFAMAILFFITVVVLVLLHDKDVIKEINSFNGQWKDVNWFKFLPKDFQSNLLDSSLAGLIDGLYNLTTNYVTMSPV